MAHWQTVTFDVPPNLWLSSNRLPSNRGHLHSIVNGLHELAGWAARAQRIRTITTPCAVLWTIHYAKSTGIADAANAQPTTKRLLDGLVKLGILEDDDDEHVTSETFRRGDNHDFPTMPLQRGLMRRVTLNFLPPLTGLPPVH